MTGAAVSVYVRGAIRAAVSTSPRFGRKATYPAIARSSHGSRSSSRAASIRVNTNVPTALPTRTVRIGGTRARGSTAPPRV